MIKKVKFKNPRTLDKLSLYLKVLVATWGNPAEWRETNYLLDSECEKGRTSLRLIKRKVNPDKTILIGLDTLAKEGSTYEEVRSSAKNIYMRHLKELDIPSDDIEIVVAPGVGSFDRWDFIGSMEDFYGYSIYMLVDKVSTLKLDAGSENLEFHLDLTHGVNFMPVLAYKAVREVAEITPMNVRLYVYNSDPYRREATKLKIHLVESSNISWKPSLNILERKPRFLKAIDESVVNDEFYRREIRELENLNVDRLNAFVGSIVNGLPLVFFTFYPDLEMLRKVVERVIMLYFRYTVVWEDGVSGRIEVRRRLSLGKDFPSLVKVTFLARMLEGFRPECGEIELEKLENLKNRFFSRNEKVNAMISSDLHRIEQVRSKLSDKWGKLRDYFEEPGGYDPRNFLAHSGLEKNVTEVRINGDRILLRYCTDYLKDIARDSARGLTPA